ncbi:MAG TPA: hypothetical protein V6D26_11195 [Stenomitos sp.]
MFHYRGRKIHDHDASLMLYSKERLRKYIIFAEGMTLAFGQWVLQSILILENLVNPSLY